MLRPGRTQCHSLLCIPGPHDVICRSAKSRLGFLLGLVSSCIPGGNWTLLPACPPLGIQLCSLHTLLPVPDPGWFCSAWFRPASTMAFPRVQHLPQKRAKQSPSILALPSQQLQRTGSSLVPGGISADSSRNVKLTDTGTTWTFQPSYIKQRTLSKRSVFNKTLRGGAADILWATCHDGQMCGAPTGTACSQRVRSQDASTECSNHTHIPHPASWG